MDTSMQRADRWFRDPLGITAVIAGLVGGLCSFLLWMYQLRPDSPLLGDYAYEIARGGPLRVQMIQLALMLGLVAIVASLLGMVGSRRIRMIVPYGIVLGAIALTYPIASMQGWIDAPLRPVLFH